MPGFHTLLFSKPAVWKAQWGKTTRDDPELFGPCPHCVRDYAAKHNLAVPIEPTDTNFRVLEPAAHWAKQCPCTSC